MLVLTTKSVRNDRFWTRLEAVARKAVGNEEVRARLTVIAYGAASSLSPQAQPVHATTSRQRELERCVRVVLVDEHRTKSYPYGTATRLRDICSASDG
jgi:flavin-dependent dehydrogenase